MINGECGGGVGVINAPGSIKNPADNRQRDFFILSLKQIPTAPKSAAYFPPHFLSAGGGNTLRQAGRSDQVDK